MARGWGRPRTGRPAARITGFSSRAAARRAWDVGLQQHSEETAAIMRAQLGDQLVVESPATGITRRDGEIVGLHHEDGTPPYDVRWSDTDEVTLVFPGPDAHIRHIEHGPGSAHEPSRPRTEQPGGQRSAEARGTPLDRPPNPGDIGRRVATERTRQGLTREETARRARMAPEYLAYLEEHPADPTVASLIRLADALGTTTVALRGGGIDLPPGLGQALLHPHAGPRPRRMPRPAFHARCGPRRGVDTARPGGGSGELRGCRRCDRVPDRAGLGPGSGRGIGGRLRGRPCG